MLCCWQIMNSSTRMFHSTVSFNGRKYASSLWLILVLFLCNLSILKNVNVKCFSSCWALTFFSVCIQCRINAVTFQLLIPVLAVSVFMLNLYLRVHFFSVWYIPTELLLRIHIHPLHLVSCCLCLAAQCLCVSNQDRSISRNSKHQYSTCVRSYLLINLSAYILILPILWWMFKLCWPCKHIPAD